MSDSLTGNLLVASTMVTDPVYAGGVCLLVHQDETNVIGVMLNRPMKPSPEALIAMFGQSPSPENRLSEFERSQDQDDNESPEPLGLQGGQTPLAGMLHFGGPLSGPVVAIHQTSQYAEAETGSGIYVAAQKQHLEDLVRHQPAPYRLIVGHLGWESDQLEAEIGAGIWHVVPATVDTVFSSSSEMWSGLIRRATSNSVARWLGIPDVVGACELN